jgi:hypothetical protein
LTERKLLRRERLRERERRGSTEKKERERRERERTLIVYLAHAYSIFKIIEINYMDLENFSYFEFGVAINFAL